MKFTESEFRAYIKKHKIASSEITEGYIAEHPAAEYHYEDIDAVYQAQVDHTISIREVHSQGEILAGLSHSTYSIRGCGGAGFNNGTRTSSGTKYGHNHM